MEPFKHYNHGIGILSALLRQNGHTTSLAIIETADLSFLKKTVSIHEPDIICFSIVSNYWRLTKTACGLIKSEFKIPIFCGGMHFTVHPQSIEETTDIDGICIGEGDEALLELVKCLEEKRDYKDVRNFWFRIDDRVIKNPIRPLMEDLGSLPRQEHLSGRLYFELSDVYILERLPL
jgi:radical SAM superfamily enzyme YgiQ (UPF0313 family)